MERCRGGIGDHRVEIGCRSEFTKIFTEIMWQGLALLLTMDAAGRLSSQNVTPRICLGLMTRVRESVISLKRIDTGKAVRFYSIVLPICHHTIQHAFTMSPDSALHLLNRLCRVLGRYCDISRTLPKFAESQRGMSAPVLPPSCRLS